MSLFHTLAVVLLVWPIWTMHALFMNYRRARRLRLTIVISLVGAMSPLWALLNQRLLPWLHLLPWGLSDLFRYNYIGWGFDDKYYSHKEQGDLFVHVTPNEIEVYVADAGAADTITSRRKDFPKPTAMYKPLEIFGPNVDTIEGKEWQRHRKITTQPFNDRNNKLVWAESLRQAQDTLQWWTQHAGMGANTTAEDVKTLALNVLTCAGFGKSYPFASRQRNEHEQDHDMTYQDALSIVLQNLLYLFLVPHTLLSLSFLPKNLRTLGKAVQVFKNHMVKMLHRERDLMSKHISEADNLVSALIRASDEVQPRQRLSDDEIFGNIFIYNLAGHETTANTLAYSILLLAAYPEYQDWLAEELDQVLEDQSEAETWKYEKVFPHLKRIMAVMYETLRLYGPVTAIPKQTTNTQQLSVHDKDYTFPSNTYIYINTSALHTHPRYWGPDSLTWRPKRWINLNPPSNSSARSHLATETMADPIRGSFMPWSEGARVCPGRTFSQVEFVAVLAVLFRRHRVKPRLLEGERAEEAKQRVLRTVEDSRVLMLLQMRRPMCISLVWTKKG